MNNKESNYKQYIKYKQNVINKNVLNSHHNLWTTDTKKQCYFSVIY